MDLVKPHHQLGLAGMFIQTEEINGHKMSQAYHECDTNS